MRRCPGLIEPSTRPLRAYALDPMQARRGNSSVTIPVAWERLKPGPQGSRIEVIDYDGGRDCYYQPVNLDDPAIAMQQGLRPSESDPQFHQQMVFAVASSVVESFDMALGRRVRFYKGRSLRLFPHAFIGSNAFYDPSMVGVLFGYYKADLHNPGPNLPGQTVFTCLSHDIIAHEVTHALIHRLRPAYNEPTHIDVPAFHEAFADIVAIFQHFSLPEVLRQAIRQTKNNLRDSGPLVELATEFGYTTGSGKALRSALDTPDPQRYEAVDEPHDRGAILVAAVFDGFFHAYQHKIGDLIRIATGGSGNLPPGEMHPLLVDKLAHMCAKTAQATLAMCIRALDYLLPHVVTFGDFLRALVTADYDLVPGDGIGLRAAMIEAFRQRGIHPQGVASLAEDSILLEAPDDLSPLQAVEPIKKLLFSEARHVSRLGDTTDGQSQERVEAQVQTAKGIHAWAKKNAPKLGMDTRHKIAVVGFHPVYRVAPDRSLLIDVIVELQQTVPTSSKDLAKRGGVRRRNGATLVVGADGQLRYAVMRQTGQSDDESVERLLDLVDRSYPKAKYATARFMDKRLTKTLGLTGLCARR